MFQRETTTATGRLISSCNFLLNREIRARIPFSVPRSAHEITFLRVDGGFAFVLLSLSLSLWSVIRLNARRKTGDWLIANEQIPRDLAALIFT